MTCDDIVALNKLETKGRTNKVQKTLDWTVDARHFTVFLPEDKNSAWLSSLEQIVNNKQCAMDELDNPVGRLNHTSIVIPMTRHLLGRVRSLINHTCRKNRAIYFLDEVTTDLTLWS